MGEPTCPDVAGRDIDFHGKPRRSLPATKPVGHVLACPCVLCGWTPPSIEWSTR